jgi:hypothetical protein
VRPLALPVVWRALDAADQDGTPEEYASQGRVLMQLLPEWTDIHSHVAARLAYDASLAQSDAGAALDRVLAGIELLEFALELDGRASAHEAIRRSQAAFLFVRCTQDDALAREFERRTGRHPSKQAEEFLRDIPRFAASPHLQSDLCFVLIDALPSRIRMGDAVLSDLLIAMELLAAVPDAVLAAQWRTSLENLRRYLTEPDDISLVELAADPRLAKIVQALEERKH